MINTAKVIFTTITLCVATSCVTMNNYRSTKAQMLATEIELSRYAAKIDTLTHICKAMKGEISLLDSTVANQKGLITHLSTENKRIKDEYSRLSEQLKEQENAVQKSSSKTKR